MKELTLEDLMAGAQRRVKIEIKGYNGQVTVRPLTLGDLRNIDEIIGSSWSNSPHEHAIQTIMAGLVSPSLSQDQVESLEKNVGDQILDAIMNASDVQSRKADTQVKK